MQHLTIILHDISPGNQDPLPIELEPGVGFWLAKQRWLWRRGRLERERMLMLGYASIDMDSYGHVEWVQMANAVASVLYGAQCTTVVRELYSAEILGGQAKFKEHVDVMDLSPIRMQRWVLTQNALWKQKGLSPVRLRYLHVLGITWILADEVLRMATPEWKARLNEVAECGEDQLSGELCIHL